MLQLQLEFSQIDIGRQAKLDPYNELNNARAYQNMLTVATKRKKGM
ncbi:hypothetical protein [Lactococcus protaetiae]|nr:hypothetical protein [Lactococcus protaetiae]